MGDVGDYQPIDNHIIIIHHKRGLRMDINKIKVDQVPN